MKKEKLLKIQIVRACRVLHPHSTVREIADRYGEAKSTIDRWLKSGTSRTSDKSDKSGKNGTNGTSEGGINLNCLLEPNHGFFSPANEYLPKNNIERTDTCLSCICLDLEYNTSGATGCYNKKGILDNFDKTILCRRYVLDYRRYDINMNTYIKRANHIRTVNSVDTEVCSVPLHDENSSEILSKQANIDYYDDIVSSGMN